MVTMVFRGVVLVALTFVGLLEYIHAEDGRGEKVETGKPLRCLKSQTFFSD
jgi:hypothetical protein